MCKQILIEKIYAMKKWNGTMKYIVMTVINNFEMNKISPSSNPRGVDMALKKAN